MRLDLWPTRISKCLCPLPIVEWPLPRVGAHVDHQGLSKTKRERAGRALVRFFSRVEARVLHQLRLSCESTGTELTLERLFPSVQTNVNYQVCPTSESPGTEATPERLHTGVRANGFGGAARSLRFGQASFRFGGCDIIGGVIGPLRRPATLHVDGSFRLIALPLRFSGMGAGDAFQAKFCVR